MRIVIQLALIVLISAAGSAAMNAVKWNAPLTLIAGTATAALLLVAYRWVIRKTEHRTADELANPKAIGFVIGAGMFGAVILNIAFLGGYEINGWGSTAGAIALLGFTAAAVVSEELLFRGILFRVIEPRIGTYAAIALTGVLFGGAHFFNPNATLWSSLAIATEAGFMLAAAYAATRNLWVPIGVHFGWNFAEGGIFSTGVSGVDAPQGLLDGVVSGPVALTGGEFGPEASVYSVLFGTLVTAGFLWQAHRRGNVLRRATKLAA